MSSSSRTSSPARASPKATASSPRSRVRMHCPECGFVNSEGANYCQKCGAFLGEPAQDSSDDQQETTAAYQVGETGELQAVDLDQVSSDGATLVIRSGGGRAGESFDLAGEQLAIGRSP